MTLDYDDLPPLTERCDCYRGIRYTGGNGPVPCELCDGTDRPTEFGMAVLDLVRRFGAKEGHDARK